MASIYQLGASISADAETASSYEFLDSLHPIATVHSKPLLFKGPADAGEWAFFGAASISNTLNIRKESYTVDAESRRVDLAAQYGATEELNVGFQLPLNWRGSGFTDDFIDDWHQTFDLPRGPRRRIEDDDYNISGVNRDGSEFNVSSRGTGLGNPQLTAEYELYPLFNPLVAISLPGIDSDFAHTGFDWSVGLRSGVNYERFGLTGFFIYQKINADSFQGIELPSGSFAIGVSGSILLTESFGLALGYFWNQSLLRELAEANSYESYLDVGVFYRSPGGPVYQFTVRENPGPQSNSVDISGVLSISAF